MQEPPQKTLRLSHNPWKSIEPISTFPPPDDFDPMIETRYKTKAKEPSSAGRHQPFRLILRLEKTAYLLTLIPPSGFRFSFAYLTAYPAETFEESFMKNETMMGVEDGLLMNEDVGSWTAEKYRQIQIYSHIFTAGMKGKWNSLVYLDLYSGSGQSRVERSQQILLGSPMIALSLDNRFDRYVLCEKDAIRQRVSERFPGNNVAFVDGDCDDPSFQIGQLIPSGALTLCFVDPYKLDIRFSTLRRLSQGRNIDFLCLLASRMDGGRNVHRLSP